MGWFSDMLETVGGWFNDLSGASDAYENSMKSWNLQNEYNSPAAQIERMKVAGIDVNPLVYAVGNGSMSSGNATGAPSKSGSGVNPLTTVMEMISGISDLKTQGKQRDAIDVQNEQTRATTQNTFANTARIQAESKNLVEDAKIKRETARQMKWENDFMERYGYRPVTPDAYFHSMYKSSYDFGSSLPSTHGKVDITAGNVDDLPNVKGLKTRDQKLRYYKLKGLNVR